MKRVLERLFDGEINPGENSNPGTEQFRAALRESDAARTALEVTLTGEQKELLAWAINARAEVTHLECVSVYSEGVRFGVELMSEVYRMDEKGPVILPYLKI